MHIAREYDTAPQANSAARHLLEHGIVAGVVYTTLRQKELEPGFGLGKPSIGAFRVLLANARDTDDARLLLDALDDDPLELDADWEDQSQIELARLDPLLAPDCPNCRETLPMLDGLDACPACAASVDIPGLIAVAHGPEVLADAHADAREEAGTADQLDESLVVAADVPCPGCGRGLGGLAGAGGCPACGAAYDKSAMIRRLFAEG